MKTPLLNRNVQQCLKNTDQGCYPSKATKGRPSEYTAQTASTRKTCAYVLRVKNGAGRCASAVAAVRGHTATRNDSAGTGNLGTDKTASAFRRIPSCPRTACSNKRFIFCVSCYTSASANRSVCCAAPRSCC